MKALRKKTGSRKFLCFVDLEGTQFTHEMIQLGAVLVKINAKGRIIKYNEPFSVFVRAKNKIGSVVTKLTGISEQTLKDKAVQYSTAMKNFKKYCGRAFEKSLFITFGNHDLKIIESSNMYNLDAPLDISRTITKNYFDITTVINEFILDKEGHALSLMNLCKLFNIKAKGVAHDASFDALNLAYLYDALLENNDLVFEEYLKVLSRGQHMPSPVSEVIKELAKGNDVSSKQFKEIVKKSLEQ